jgi:flagellar hook protein FlgE
MTPSATATCWVVYFRKTATANQPDFSGSTQFGSTLRRQPHVQDGYTSGRLSGVVIGSDGIVQGRYSNGQSRNLGQVVLANFNNPNGLQPLGGNRLGETSISGQPARGAPGTGSLGVLQSAAQWKSPTSTSPPSW